MNHNKWVDSFKEEFANHEIVLHKTSTYKDTVGNTHSLEHMLFKAPETGMYRIEYIMRGGMLFVTGDLGDAIYWWSERHDLEWVSRCDLGYFSGKCTASEVGREFVQWDEKRALERVESELAELEDEDKRRRFKKWKGHKNLSSHFEWMEWLDQAARGVEENTKGEYFFGEDWHRHITGIGFVTHIRCKLHLAGLKFAMRKKNAQ